MTDWQPIETAPKDGRKLLLGKWRQGHWVIEVGRYVSNRYGAGLEWFEVRASDFQPSHWMPLPEPPK